MKQNNYYMNMLERLMHIVSTKKNPKKPNRNLGKLL